MAMDFRQATDELLAGISHERLAEVLGVSVSSVRQARLAEGAKAHRKPPKDWEDAVAGMAEIEGYRLLKLAQSLDKVVKARWKSSRVGKGSATVK